MHPASLGLALALTLIPLAAGAVGPTVKFTLPAENATPGTFGSLPFPCDLYFDQGRPGDGDGTLLDAGSSMGLAADVVRANPGSVEDAYDIMDGFGTTSATFFFFSGAVDAASLPASPVRVPSLADAVFCADVATLTPVPILLKLGVDTRIPNVLSVLPAPGKPLAAKTAYACVVRRSVTGGGEPVEPSADWVAVRDGTSANGDADAIFDPVVTALGTAGVPASAIAGMTVFTTESTSADLLAIRDDVLPTLPVPTADFTSQPDLVFQGDTALQALLGRAPAAIATIATGFYDSARFQSHDPNGDGPISDLPVPPDFVTCLGPSGLCETADERFTRDAMGRPVVVDVPKIPFTIVIPSGTPPPNGWPVVFQQHGLGGQRDTILAFAEMDAERGFASIGIDAAQHGYRLFDCGPAARCTQDTANTLGGTAVPDGFVDGTFATFDVSFLAVNLGFFQAFHNFVGIRDNFRQTYADLLSLVRLLKGGTIDTALDTKLDAANIFYMGHSLGGLMGSGFVPIDVDLRAALLNATGGGLTNQLFVNSSIGAGAFELVNAILGLDPMNVEDQFALMPNLTQAILDPADGINSAHLILEPGNERNVIQVEDFGDEVVPNQGSDALAVASNLPIFDPFVQNLHLSPFALPIVPTPRTLHANAGGGAVTAALVQNGPATHAFSLFELPGTLSLVPEHAHPEEFPATGQAFPTLERPIRVPNAGIFGAVLDWFHDIAVNGPPGTFSFGGDPNYNPVHNLEVPAGASTQRFFARTVDAGGTLETSEPTPDVVVDFASNAVASRMTAGRSILGTSAAPSDLDVPPGPSSTVGTPGFLPFFVTLQRALPGTFGATLTIAYTEAELTAAGIAPGSLDEGSLVIATFEPGTCTLGGASCSEDGNCGANGPCVGAGYTPFVNTTVDAVSHAATAAGVTEFSTFAVIAARAFETLVPGGGSARTDCRAKWQLVNPAGVPTCRDGDPTCDADGAADGTCTFRLAVCFNRPDVPPGGCTAGNVVSYKLKRPRLRGGNAIDRANAQALLSNLAALGGRVTRRGTVRFTPGITQPVCSPLAAVSVPVGSGKHAGKLFRGIAGGHGADRDTLLLLCSPAS